MGVMMATIIVNGGKITIKKSHNDCFVDIARNHLVKSFMESECTHMLMVDDDMGWNPMAVEKMLMFDKEFIAGAGPLKGKEKRFAFRDGKEHPDGLWEVDHIGGAFCLFKRSIFEKMIEAYPETYSEYYKGHHLFKMEVDKDKVITEDFNFCRKWREIGGKIWCYPDISFEHYGNFVWHGNFYEQLKENDAKEISK